MDVYDNGLLVRPVYTVLVGAEHRPVFCLLRCNNASEASREATRLGFPWSRIRGTYYASQLQAQS